MNARTTRRSWLGGILAGALALLGAACPAVAAPPADSAGVESAIAPADPLLPYAPTDPRDVEVVLDEISPEVIRPGDELTFAGTIRNHTDEDLTSAIVSIRMQRHVPTDEGLSQWLEGTSNTNVVVIARARVADPDAERAEFEITLGEDESPFTEGSTWGPHGIEVAVETNLGTDAARSTITWFPSRAPDGSPASLTTLAPLQPTTSEWTDALDADTTVAAASGDRLGGVIEALQDSAVTWAVDPVLLEAVPVSTRDVLATAGAGDSPAPDANEPTDEQSPPNAEVTDFAGRIAEAAAGRPVLDLGYGAPDYEALLGAGSETGEQLLSEGDERAAELYEAADLATIDRTVWPSVRLSEIARQHLAGANRLAIHTASRFATSAYTSTPEVPMATLTGNHRLSSDVLSEHDPTERRELIARSALAVRAAPDVPIVLTLPRALNAEQARLIETNLRTLTELPWFTPRDLPDTTETPLTLRPDAASTEEPPEASSTDGALDRDEIAGLADDTEAVLTIAALTDDPSSFSGGYLPELLGATAASWREEPAGRTELIAGVHLRASRLATAITVETPSTINLISRGGEVPITIANSLPQAVNVGVRLAPGDARLRADEIATARLPAEAASTVRVPIHAVANGNVEVSVHVLDAADEDVAEPTRFSIRVRADWEDTGTAIVAGALLALFVFGLVRTIRRGRRRAEG